MNNHAPAAETNERFDDDVFRAIVDHEHAKTGDEAPGVEGLAASDAELEPKPMKKGSVREAAAAIDQRLAAIAGWLGHLEGVEPVEIWETEVAGPDVPARLGLRSRCEGDAWLIETTFEGGTSWMPAQDGSISERLRALELSQELLRLVVEQQRKLIAELRGAVKAFDVTAASLGVRVGR